MIVTTVERGGRGAHRAARPHRGRGRLDHRAVPAVDARSTTCARCRYAVAKPRRRRADLRRLPDRPAGLADAPGQRRAGAAARGRARPLGAGGDRGDRGQPAPALSLPRGGAGMSPRRSAGFNRAKAAVLELAILTSRLDMLPRDKIDERNSPISQIAIDKTAGRGGTEAWGWLMERIARPSGRGLSGRSGAQPRLAANSSARRPPGRRRWPRPCSPVPPIRVAKSMQRRFWRARKALDMNRPAAGGDDRRGGRQLKADCTQGSRPRCARSCCSASQRGEDAPVALIAHRRRREPTMRARRAIEAATILVAGRRRWHAGRRHRAAARRGCGAHRPSRRNTRSSAASRRRGTAPVCATRQPERAGQPGIDELAGRQPLGVGEAARRRCVPRGSARCRWSSSPCRRAAHRQCGCADQAAVACQLAEATPRRSGIARCGRRRSQRGPA